MKYHTNSSGYECSEPHLLRNTSRDLDRVLKSQTPPTPAALMARTITPIIAGAPLAGSIFAVITTSHALVNALPTNRTHEPTFVNEPPGRGTIGLVVSCVLTLVLCVWTAMHVDVLDRPLPFRRLANKTTWVMVGLFAPEIILATAYIEWGLARKLLRVMQLTSASDIAETAATAAEAVAALTATSAASLVCAHRSPRTDTIVANAAKASEAALRTAAKAKAAAKVAAEQIAAARNVIGASEEKKAREMSNTASSTALDLARSAAAATRAAIRTQKKAETALRRIQQSDHAPSHSDTDANRLAENTSAILEMVQPHRLWKWLGDPAGKFRGWFDLVGSDQFGGVLGMEGAFFGVMGGFMLCPLYPSKQHGFPLRSEDLIYLLEKELLVSSDLGILKEDVADKGKADMVAKLLVCSQALWMTINCLCRKISGLPVTLLEIHVVVHVLCTVVVYLFWWRKPQDVGLHLTLGSVDKGRSAFIFTAGFENLNFAASRTIPDPVQDKDLVDDFYSTPPPCCALGDQDNTETVPLQRPFEVDDPCHGFSFNVSGDWEYNTSVIKIFHEAAEELRKGRFVGHIADNPDEKYPLRIQGLDSSQVPVQPESRTIWGEAIVECKASLWALYWLGIGYSSFHSSAWNYSFPTEIEKWLWRVSCIIIGSLGLVVYSYTFVMDKLNFRSILSRYKPSPEWCCIVQSVSFLWTLLRLLLVLVYVSARVFLVVESFISIRSLPEGSYRSIPWAELWPHF